MFCVAHHVHAPGVAPKQNVCIGTSVQSHCVLLTLLAHSPSDGHQLQRALSAAAALHDVLWSA